MEIREARIGDAKAACDVLRRSITELCQQDHGNEESFLARWLSNKTPENVAGWISDKSIYTFVAEEFGAIIGVGAITTAGKILLNYVSPEARFRGVSKALLNCLETKAIELGLKQCTLESTLTARRLYLSAGYIEAEGHDSCCQPMSKRLYS